MDDRAPLPEYEGAQVTYDAEGDCWYVDLDTGKPYDDQYADFRIAGEPRVRTVILDYDDDGYVVGIEII